MTENWRRWRGFRETEKLHLDLEISTRFIWWERKRQSSTSTGEAPGPEVKAWVENVQAASTWKCLNLMEYRIPFGKIKMHFNLWYEIRLLCNLVPSWGAWKLPSNKFWINIGYQTKDWCAKQPCRKKNPGGRAGGAVCIWDGISGILNSESTLP